MLIIIGSILIVIVLLILSCIVYYLGNVKWIYSKDAKISKNTEASSCKIKGQSLDELGYIGELEFEGIWTMWEYKVENDCEIEISYLLSVSSGKAKLVLVNPMGKTEILVENKDNTTQREIEIIKVLLKKGESRIKLVAADKAKIEIKLQISVGKFNTGTELFELAGLI